jgi:hypothetical protein
MQQLIFNKILQFMDFRGSFDFMLHSHHFEEKTKNYKILKVFFASSLLSFVVVSGCSCYSRDGVRRSDALHKVARAQSRSSPRGHIKRRQESSQPMNAKLPRPVSSVFLDFIYTIAVDFHHVYEINESIMLKNN